MAAIFDYTGQFVTLTTADGQAYEGTVCAIDDLKGKIVLKNASTKGTKLPGLQNFYVSNISDLTLADECKNTDITSGHQAADSRKKPRYKSLRYGRDNRQRSHLDGLEKFDSDLLVKSHCAGYESGDQGFGSGEDTECVKDFYEGETFIMYFQTCDKFRESIAHIMDQDKIAVTFYGTSICRNGVLSLIQIASEEALYVFDILRLGREGFVDGLQAVLEAKSVIKIIHDCRMISDLLYHQFSVSLHNVFDTQVAAAFVFRSSNNGDWPRFVDSLPSVLMSQLKLLSEDVHQFYIRERSQQKDEEVWLQRPLCGQLLVDSLKNLVHLIPLYHRLRTKLMLEFQLGVELYLDHARKSPPDTGDNRRSLNHLLPYVFQELPKLANSLSRDHRSFPRPRPKYDSHGFRDACTKAGGMVTTSKDSIWHSKKHFQRVSCDCGDAIRCGSTKDTDYDGRRNKSAYNNTSESESKLKDDKNLSKSFSHSCNITSTAYEKYNYNSDEKPVVSNLESSECTRESILGETSYLDSGDQAQSTASKQHLGVNRHEEKLSTSVSSESNQTSFENSSSGRSVCLQRSALMQLSPSCDLDLNSIVKSRPDLLTTTSEEDKNACVVRVEGDEEECMTVDLVKKVLRQARSKHANTGAKRRLLPYKPKIL